MKNLIFPILLLFLTAGFSSPERPADNGLRQILLAQLKTTHSQKDWFVPVNIALQGVTADQANWTDKSGNHSIGQLTYHLVFWNQRQLEKFKGMKPADFTGDNNETFTAFDKNGWTQLVSKLDKVMVDLESVVTNATDAQLNEIAPTIANISTHNAYHTGQIIYERKLQGSWNPELGVK